MGKKVYAVVRPSLSDAQKAVQAAHALVELTMTHRELEEKRLWGHESLVLLRAGSDEEFESIIAELHGATPYFSIFREPYYGGLVTAAAFLGNEATRQLTRTLKLMIKEVGQGALPAPSPARALAGALALPPQATRAASEIDFGDAPLNPG